MKFIDSLVGPKAIPSVSAGVAEYEKCMFNDMTRILSLRLLFSFWQKQQLVLSSLQFSVSNVLLHGAGYDSLLILLIL